MCNTTYKTLFNNRTQYLPQNRGEGRPWVHNIGILLEGGGHTQQGQGHGVLTLDTHNADDTQQHNRVHTRTG